MKRLKFIIASVLLTAILLLSAACSGEPLRTPGGFILDDNDTLTWSVVNGARTYTVRVVDADDGTEEITDVRRASISLSKYEEGDYDIYVRAVGGNNGDTVSEWSEAIAFHREHDYGMTFRLINNNAEYSVRSVGAASGEVEIPAYYRNRPVTLIERAAFRSRSAVTGVVFPETVRTIEDNAFYNSGLTSVTVPETIVSLGEHCFDRCLALEKVQLPDSITELPAYAFAYCSALTEVKLGSKVVSIGESAFQSCGALRSFDIPDTVTHIGAYALSLDAELRSITVGSGMTAVDDHAFYGNKALSEVEFRDPAGEMTFGEGAFASCTALGSLIFPEGVTRIGVSCFRDCTSLSEIGIPDSVTSVGAYAFENTKLLSDQIDSGKDFQYAGKWVIGMSNRAFGAEDGGAIDTFTEDTFEAGTVGFADQAFIKLVQTNNGTQFSGSRSLGTVNLAPSIKYIGSFAFYSTPYLRSFTATREDLDYQLVSIGSAAFQMCVYLTNVQLPRGLRDIGTSAFSGCTSLSLPIAEERLMPNTVTHVGENAFGDTAIAQTAQDGIIYVGGWAVGYTALTNSEVTLREGTVGIADFAFAESAVGTIRLQSPDMLYLGTGAFYGCMGLQNAIFGQNSGITRIEPFTFYSCASLQNIGQRLPRYLENIGECAFTNCVSLSNLDLSGTRVKEIGEFAFYGAGIVSLTLNDGLEKIDRYAFYYIPAPRVVIPDTVASLGERAFGWCPYLQTVTLGSGLEEIGDYAFRDCYMLTAVNIPASVKKIGNYAFYQCINIQSLTFEEGVEEIGNYAFYLLASVREIRLPASVKSVGELAFKNCVQLRTLSFLGTPEYVGKNAFYGCNRLTVYAAGESGSGSDWNVMWNSSRRPVFWGTEFSEDGDVVSVDPSAIENPFAYFGVSAPMSAEKDCVGWAESPDATEAEYSADEAFRAAPGTKLYPVWSARPANE